jgi:hypothetical protein
MSDSFKSQISAVRRRPRSYDDDFQCEEEKQVSFHRLDDKYDQEQLLSLSLSLSLSQHTIHDTMFWTYLTLDMVKTDDGRQQFLNTVTGASVSRTDGDWDATSIPQGFVTFTDRLQQDRFSVELVTVRTFQLVRECNLQFIRVHAGTVQGMGEPVGQLPYGSQRQLDVVVGPSTLATSTVRPHAQ